jgi:hypothetical protein
VSRPFRCRDPPSRSCARPGNERRVPSGSDGWKDPRHAENPSARRVAPQCCPQLIYTR